MILVILKMEWSERSGQKTSSTDFSIERILSEEPRRPTETPDWLCCTRYRPPRLPRKLAKYYFLISLSKNTVFPVTDPNWFSTDAMRLIPSLDI